MTRHRAVIGLSLLSALLLSAFAAQSASALVVTKSTNTTGFTCVKDPEKKGGFKDAHCDEPVTLGTGEYGHVAIPIGQKLEGDGTNEKITNGTKDKEPAVLKGTIGLAKVTIECANGNAKNPVAENTEPKAGQHTAVGSGAIEFSTCNVKELNKCVVAEPIVAGATGHGVEGMEGPKGEKNAMGIELVGAGAEERFTEIEFKNKGAEACSLNGKKFPISGRVVATNGPTTESKQDNKYTGSTVIFTPKFKMQTLKLGPNPATIEAMGTVSVSGGGNPISMTTTT